jgi:transcriptional regulator with XRE-family HTH domain
MKHRSSRGFVPATAHASLSTGQVIRMLRNLKGWTQEQLVQRSGISATNISLLENGRVDIGKKRVEQLAAALDVHPAIIMFPEYEAREIAQSGSHSEAMTYPIARITLRIELSSNVPKGPPPASICDRSTVRTASHCATQSFVSPNWPALKGTQFGSRLRRSKWAEVRGTATA